MIRRIWIRLTQTRLARVVKTVVAVVWCEFILLILYFVGVALITVGARIWEICRRSKPWKM